MSKGMNLEEFKNALSSDATKENEMLKKEINTIKKESFRKNDELTKELKQYKEWCTALGNRCFVLTGGSMCLNCRIPACKYLFTDSEINAAMAYMKTQKLPRTDETAKIVSEFLEMKRFKRINACKGE